MNGAIWVAENVAVVLAVMGAIGAVVEMGSKSNVQGGTSTVRAGGGGPDMRGSGERVRTRK